jgi:hypothetical protein
LRPTKAAIFWPGKVSQPRCSTRSTVPKSRDMVALATGGFSMAGNNRPRKVGTFAAPLVSTGNRGKLFFPLFTRRVALAGAVGV